MKSWVSFFILKLYQKNSNSKSDLPKFEQSILPQSHIKPSQSPEEKAAATLLKINGLRYELQRKDTQIGAQAILLSGLSPEEIQDAKVKAFTDILYNLAKPNYSRFEPYQNFLQAFPLPQELVFQAFLSNVSSHAAFWATLFGHTLLSYNPKVEDPFQFSKYFTEPQKEQLKNAIIEGLLNDGNFLLMVQLNNEYDYFDFQKFQPQAMQALSDYIKDPELIKFQDPKKIVNTIKLFGKKFRIPDNQIETIMMSSLESCLSIAHHNSYKQLLKLINLLKIPHEWLVSSASKAAHDLLIDQGRDSDAREILEVFLNMSPEESKKTILEFILSHDEKIKQQGQELRKKIVALSKDMPPTATENLLDLTKVFSSKEKKTITRNRIERRMREGDRWFSVARRALQEMMPTQKYEAYAGIAMAIANHYNLELSRDNVTFSTNRFGEHSWYIFLPNPTFSDKLPEKGSRLLAIKITDHLTNLLQTHDRDGVPIIETYIIQDNNEYAEVVNTAINKKNRWSSYRDEKFNEDDSSPRVTQTVPIADLAKFLAGH